MKPSLAFTLAVLFFQAIPLLEARQLRLDKADHPHLSLLPRTGTSKEAGEALVVDYVEPERRSSDGEEEVAPGATDDGLHRPAARSPPSPQGGKPPHWAMGSAPWAGGSRKPSPPPAPTGKNPPHWRESGDRLSPRPVDMFHVLRVLTKMFC
ncbi:unnamed protein product [Alopecurus aequalis]